MPYEYFKLSYQQRISVLQQRISQNYPLHAPTHPFRDAGYYLITAANYNHQPILSTPERRSEFERMLLQSFDPTETGFAGWAILLNHYHFLIGVESMEIISSALKLLHGRSSFAWNKADGIFEGRRVWYKFSDRKIRNEAHFQKALNYIHINPLKHGYVTDVYDWKWSSLPIYLEQIGRDQLAENWKKFNPGGMGQDWDE